MQACTFLYILSLSCFITFVMWYSQRLCRKALEISAYLLEVSRNLKASSNQSKNKVQTHPRFPKSATTNKLGKKLCCTTWDNLVTLPCLCASSRNWGIAELAAQVVDVCQEQISSFREKTLMRLMKKGLSSFLKKKNPLRKFWPVMKKTGLFLENPEAFWRA